MFITIEYCDFCGMKIDKTNVAGLPRVTRFDISNSAREYDFSTKTSTCRGCNTQLLDLINKMATLKEDAHD